MKIFNLVLVYFFCLINVNCQIPNKIAITYLGYSRSVYQNDFPSLEFELTNTSNDTLYLSKKNIIVTVTKGKAKLREDKATPHVTPFVRPVIRRLIRYDAQIKYERTRDSLKLNFAQNLYNRNLGINHGYNKTFVLETIIRDCIILLPNESIDYSSGFKSEVFDKNCKVAAKYVNDKVFTSFLDDNMNRIYILN